MLVAQGVGHPDDERLGDVVLASVGDDPPQLCLEPVGPDAGPAHVQVPGDLQPALLGELAIQVEVEAFDGLVATEEARGACESLSTEPLEAPGTPGTPCSPTACSPCRAALPGYVYLASSAAPTNPLALPRSINAFWSALLPRWIRLMTVPMGTSVMSAISL